MTTSVSEVSICNLALQLLGAERIDALTQAVKNARECKAAYAMIRDRELSAHPWNFARGTASLPASATVPDDTDFDNAFPLPADFLELIEPKDRADLDWQIVDHLDAPAIVTNDSAPLKIAYVKAVTDPTKFPMTFVYALAAALAEHLAEALTQSNSKKEDAAARYARAIAMARRRNAFQNSSAEPPEDDWISARR